ncbi:Uncharacterised protein [Pragia fontium]|uniref:Uncharacterized protein n=2 Tax=Pragia fontium TaxID=82985 RepID=A0AAJ4W8I6_9GAMM|nr:hypothetical protein [Pragia fontium]GKX63178.1 hypothetical protein SOASR032_17470 [Pragia fontium]SFC19468.1 hypothetical protein SAMN02745723_101622 [Pragia fontium DSM 5563 = ATCC 49100]SUB81202.1 Uncharacterised protein [Pragia fontium]
MKLLLIFTCSAIFMFIVIHLNKKRMTRYDYAYGIECALIASVADALSKLSENIFPESNVSHIDIQPLKKIIIGVSKRQGEKLQLLIDEYNNNYDGIIKNNQVENLSRPALFQATSDENIKALKNSAEQLLNFLTDEEN